MMAFVDTITRMFRAAPPPPPQPPKPPEPIFGEIAFTDPTRLVGRITRYNPSELVGARGLQIFEQMAKDPEVRACLKLKINSACNTGWVVNSSEGKPAHWPPTAFSEWVFDNLDENEIGATTLDGDLVELATNALTYGFALSEKIWTEITYGPWRGRIALHALKARSPHGLVFEQDQYGNLVPDGIIQQSNPKNRLPRDKFVLFSHEAAFGNPYGQSDLTAAHLPWWVKTQATKWLAMLLERLGIPPIFGLYNPSAMRAARWWRI
jgi:hypothetical protein